MLHQRPNWKSRLLKLLLNSLCRSGIWRNLNLSHLLGKERAQYLRISLLELSKILRFILLRNTLFGVSWDKQFARADQFQWRQEIYPLDLPLNLMKHKFSKTQKCKFLKYNHGPREWNINAARVYSRQLKSLTLWRCQFEQKVR